MDDRLGELSRSNALLGSALAELRAYRISYAIADALIGVSVTDAELSEFLDLAARDVPPNGVYSLALVLPTYIDRRHAGHGALDYCLTQGNLSEDAISSVASRMASVTSADAVVWCHRRLTTVIRLDREYCDFLSQHIATIVDRCRDEMIAYLLYPDRGPASANIDAFELVVRVLDDPGPFLRRWQEWVWDGLFDPGDRPGASSASLHYRILNKRWGEPAYVALRKTTHDYAGALLRSPDPAKRACGAHHAATMASLGYLGADQLVRHVPTSEFPLLYSALAAVAAANAAPANQALQDRADTLRSEVISAREFW